MAGQGEPGTNGGPAGDLYIFLEVKEHPFFERRGSDLYCTIPVSVHAGCARCDDQSSHAARRRRARNSRRHAVRPDFPQKREGLANPHGGRGELYIIIRVVIPAKVSREQRRILEQLGQTMKVENKPAERSASFFDKVKDIFG